MPEEATTDEPAELTSEQKAEMMVQYRELKRTGKPELAYPILTALEAGVYRTVEESALEPDPGPQPPPRHGIGSGKKEWRAYAKEVSVMDDEIIDSFSRKDVIKALEANGLLEKLDADTESGDEDDDD